MNQATKIDMMKFHVTVEIPMSAIKAITQAAATASDSLGVEITPEKFIERAAWLCALDWVYASNEEAIDNLVNIWTN